ncbi:hypothetical protein KFK09_017898 [Dendrobium nobile]|uniref:Uncharacterized protein n=1 Tax=Dendrobium nobile TaxID=94219 RepID=A0A8T3AU77_DENNO|nr:hypothetical protein KFK09_017898 [Dendrobium nobile]
MENLNMLFIDLEKAYDKFSREMPWRVLEKKQAYNVYIQVIKGIYTGAIACIQIMEVNPILSLFSWITLNIIFKPISFCFSHGYSY